MHAVILSLFHSLQTYLTLCFCFQPNCLYYWTHTQATSTTQVAEPGKLTPQWPPTQHDVEEMRPGLKYTEAG